MSKLRFKGLNGKGTDLLTPGDMVGADYIGPVKLHPNYGGVNHQYRIVDNKIPQINGAIIHLPEDLKSCILPDTWELAG